MLCLKFQSSITRECVFGTPFVEACLEEGVFWSEDPPILKESCSPNKTWEIERTFLVVTEKLWMWFWALWRWQWHVCGWLFLSCTQKISSFQKWWRSRNDTKSHLVRLSRWYSANARRLRRFWSAFRKPNPPTTSDFIKNDDNLLRNRRNQMFVPFKQVPFSTLLSVNLQQKCGNWANTFVNELFWRRLANGQFRFAFVVAF